MTAVKCTVTLDNLIQHLEVDIDCTVLEVNPTLFPKVKPGMIVSSINDISVRDRTDLKVEMLAISQNPKTAKAPIVMLFEVRDAAEDSNTPISLVPTKQVNENKKRDELDFDSDEEKPPEPKFSVDSGKQVILNAVNKTAPGACILLLCERYNPAYQIEEAARSRDITVMHIDAVVRVKSRLPMKEFGSTLRKSLERGVWMFIENASKSITLLQELVECIIAAKEKKSIHTNSRVLLLCEPHPYFPPQLLEGAVTLRMRMAPGEQVLEETIKDPRSKLQLMQGTNQSSSKGPNLPTTSMKSVQ